MSISRAISLSPPTLHHVIVPALTGNLGSTGDSTGNIGWGFEPQEIMHFPEVEANYSVSLFFLSVFLSFLSTFF